MNTHTLFRIVAFSEGFSYLALLMIAMPLKYIWNTEEYVQNIGMAHGLLFIVGFSHFIYTIRVQHIGFKENINIIVELADLTKPKSVVS